MKPRFERLVHDCTEGPVKLDILLPTPRAIRPGEGSAAVLAMRMGWNGRQMAHGERRAGATGRVQFVSIHADRDSRVPAT